MLVLTRRLNQDIIIGDDIRITIIGFDRNQVRLGFEAPKEVRIDREEIRKRDKREDD
jgi:carbon storage regulator